MKSRVYSFLVCALVVGAMTSAPAAACSVCRCGDPTFNALGTNVFTGGQLRLAVDFERLEKDQGIDAVDVGSPADSGDEAEGRESLRETRQVVTLSYALSDRFEGVVRLPWSQRELSGAEESTSVDGLGDPEVYGLFRLWSAPMRHDVGRGSWVSLLAGAKTPWGANDERRNGARLDEHAQPGTGSTDPFAGLAAVHLFDQRSTLYGSVQIRRPGRNGAGYKYGDLVLANLGYERKLGGRLDAALELNARDAAEDEVDRDGALDPDTGGRIAFLSPRLLVDLGHSVVLRASVQIPVYDGLDGAQTESAVVDIGFTASF